MSKYWLFIVMSLSFVVLFGQENVKPFPESRNSLEYRLIGSIDKGFYFNNNTTNSIIYENNRKQSVVYDLKDRHLEDWKVVGTNSTHDLLFIKVFLGETHETESLYIVVDRTKRKPSVVNIGLAQFIGSDAAGNLYFIPEADQENSKFEKGLICLQSPNFSIKQLFLKYQIRDGVVKDDMIYAIGFDEKDHQVYLSSKVR